MEYLFIGASVAVFAGLQKNGSALYKSVFLHEINTGKPLIYWRFIDQINRFKASKLISINVLVRKGITGRMGIN